jgi:prepilin-type processing-associated H-X9-DG protein
LGVDPLDVEEVVAFVEPPLAGPPEFGVTIHFVQSFDTAKLPPPVLAQLQPENLADRPYLQNANPMLPSLFMQDDQTLLVGRDVTIRRLLELPKQAPSGALIDRAREIGGGNDLYLAVDVAALRPVLVPIINMSVAQRRTPLPDELRPFLSAPNLISAAELTVNLSAARSSSLAVHANDATAADALESMVSHAIEQQQQKARQFTEKMLSSDDPIEQAFGRYLDRMSKMPAGRPPLVRRGDSLVVFDAVIGGPDKVENTLVLAAVSGVLVAMLLPAVQAAREAARRNQSMNNLKQLVLSLHNYADSHKKFPAHAIYSKEGKPLLSWRVQVLPYLEEQALYNEFHLDEPWDSPHNRTLIARMPEVFANPSLAAAAEGKTNCLAVVGKNCVFDGSKDGIGFAQISDGTSKTIVLVEADADQAVEWTKPDDWEFDAKNPKAGIGQFRPGGCNAAWADGRVSFLSNGIDPEILKALMTRNGREVIDHVD